MKDMQGDFDEKEIVKIVIIQDLWERHTPALSTAAEKRIASRQWN